MITSRPFFNCVLVRNAKAPSRQKWAQFGHFTTHCIVAALGSIREADIMLNVDINARFAKFVLAAFVTQPSAC